ncbi:MAG: DNA polymerase IV 1 [Chlamydiae bacterium]|nr:DNA polymerase IV 1 [Chlamydiota bacterium]
MYALIDCNNFFASCEKVFNPAYKSRPLVVLSNNDGCVIARSKEAKALAIPMGAPAFEYQSLFLQHNVIVLSSNFALYGDISHRVIETLKTFDFPVEIYSIDEAFLILPDENSMEIGRAMRERVKQWTGISVSVGIAPTKTLAKVANHAAKKGAGVVRFTPSLLENLPVGKIWGVGRRISKKLMSHGIRYAHELIECSDIWIKKKLSIVGLRTAWELRGTPCLEMLEVAPARKSVLTSRSFKRAISSIEELREAVATFIAIAAKKLRREKLKAYSLLVFAGRESGTVHLPLASSYTPDLINLAHRALEGIYQKGESIKRAGVMLSELVSEDETQLDLFAQETAKNHLMKTVDQINSRYGESIITFAGEGISKKWKRAPSRRSPRYTTSWEDLPKISS